MSRATPDAPPRPSTANGEELASALPVALTVSEPLRGSVVRWVEGVLGWQPVDLDAERLVPPVIELCDGSRPASRRGVPRLLLVEEGATAGAAAELAISTGARASLTWPAQREELPALAAALLADRRAAPAGPRSLVVGGSAGGVGTTTVALCIAGLWTWSGMRTLAALRGTTPAVRAVPVAALAARDVHGRAEALPGVPGLRAVRLLGVDPPPELTDPTVDGFVLDAGVDVDADVLVCRPDGSARVALAETTAAVVIVVGQGPVSDAQLRRASGGRRLVRLPMSARIARAGVAGRIPAAVPGSILRHLAPLRPRPLATPVVGPSTGAEPGSAPVPAVRDPAATPVSARVPTFATGTRTASGHGAAPGTVP